MTKFYKIRSIWHLSACWRQIKIPPIGLRVPNACNRFTIHHRKCLSGNQAHLRPCKTPNRWKNSTTDWKWTRVMVFQRCRIVIIWLMIKKGRQDIIRAPNRTCYFRPSKKERITLKECRSRTKRSKRSWSSRYTKVPCILTPKGICSLQESNKGLLTRIWTRLLARCSKRKTVL